MKSEIPTKEKLQASLEFELSQLGDNNPQIVRAIGKILREPVAKEKPIIIKGKVVDHYTEYSPSMNSFYQEGVSETERVANLLFWSNKLLRPLQLGGIKSRLKDFLNREAIERDEKMAERIDGWIENLYKRGSKTREFESFGIYITSLVMPEGLYYWGITWDTVSRFNADLARIVFRSLENGMEPEKVLNALKGKDFLIPYVGIDSPVTWKDLDRK